MKKYLVLLLVFLAGNAFPQQEKIDSIRALVNLSATDSARQYWLIELSWKLMNAKKYLESEKAAMEALEVSKKMKSNKPIAESYVCLAESFWYRDSLTNAFNYYVRALRVWQKEGNQKKIADMYIEVALVAKDQNRDYRYDTGLNFYRGMDSARGILEKLITEEKDPKKLKGIKKSLARVYNETASGLADRGDPKKATKLHLKALEYYTEIDNKNGIADTYFDLGYNNRPRIRYVGEDSEKSIEYMTEAYKRYQLLGDKYKTAKTEKWMGCIYKNRNQSDSALKYLFLAEKYFKSINDKYNLKDVYHFLSGVYGHLGDAVKQKEYWSLYTSD
ncbi:MAG TPA: tetratricopeptide repeat protein [Nitrosopumilaceae archaeon]|jgi:tetratricopeptide (TPR) repeat protein|nr:tetratricopeptide repeat protein [Nitrosopumilaceae archaeon]